LPELFAVAGGGVGGGAHAGEEELFAIGREVHGVDAPGVVVALDDAPACEARGGPSGGLPAGGEVPDADFAHEVAGGEVFAIGAEGDGLHGRNVGKAVEEFAGGGVEDFDGGLALRGGFVFVAAAKVLAGDGGDAFAVWGEGGLPGPELVGLDGANGLALGEVVPAECAIVSAGDKDIGTRHAMNAGGVAVVFAEECQGAGCGIDFINAAVEAGGVEGFAIGRGVEAEDGRGEFELAAGVHLEGGGIGLGGGLCIGIAHGSRLGSVVMGEAKTQGGGEAFNGVGERGCFRRTSCSGRARRSGKSRVARAERRALPLFLGLGFKSVTAFGLAGSGGGEYFATSMRARPACCCLARMLLNRPTLPGLLVAILLSTVGRLDGAVATSAAEGNEFFEKRIRPVLVEHCYECHSAERGRTEGGLALDTREGLFKGGKSGTALVAGEAERSLLIRTLHAVDGTALSVSRHRLAPVQLADLTTWVNMGAPDPRTGDAKVQPAKADTHRHWAFQPIKDPVPPVTHNRRWANNAIDRFMLARMESAGVSPSLAADRRTLIRRVTFDLIGLPPTPGEIDAFLRDGSANAFEKVVERLLASPRYGERWGRHWLDVARYADSSGDSSDYPIPQARLYRDYVIAAFNKDKPYDEFIREQIAGDLMPSESEAQKRERIIATGFVALSRRFASGGPETRHLTIENTLDTIGQSLLGLSMSCARCHDHKHDPITMRDYYALYGIFDSTQYPHPGAEGRSYQTNFVPLIPLAEVEARLKPHREKIAALDAEIARMDRQLDTLAKEGLNTEDLRPTYEKVWKERDALADHPPLVEDAYAVIDATPVNARIQKRGEPHNLGEEVPRGFLKMLGGQQVSMDCKGSGRGELARWLTEPANPLTARVMVNRIWQHHFGKGLVATPSDFGTHGSAPTNPELIDYLATRFIECGWSVKAMHRLIVGSATYQQGSAESESLIAGFPRQRLDAEQIRDALLSVSGRIDLEPGGPHPFPPAWKWDYTQHKQFNAVYPTDKRSVYLMQQRIRRHPFLATFDGADVNSSTAERPLTTTALQALFVMNDPFLHELAEEFADRLLREARDDRQRIDLAHQLAFGRPARREEIAGGMEYLGKVREKLRGMKVPGKDEAFQAWSSYARAVLGSSEFIFVD